MSDESGFNQQLNCQQQPPQHSCGQPQTTYTPSPAISQAGKGTGWIKFLRVFLWIWFALICLAGVIAFVRMISTGYDEAAWMGFLILAGAVLLAFVSIAGGMVALDAAANISRCATNSARILDLLQQKK